MARVAVMALLALALLACGEGGPRAEPTPECAQLATGEEPRVSRSTTGPGVYRIGKYQLVLPEGMKLRAHSHLGESWHGHGETETSGEDTHVYIYELLPGGNQAVIEHTVAYTHRYHDDGTESSTQTERVQASLQDQNGDRLRTVRVDCRCPGARQGPDLRPLAVIYCHVEGNTFEHPDWPTR